MNDTRDPITIPTSVAGSGTLDRLVETARGYAQQAASENTLKAYAKDWAHFARWCRMKGADPLPPSPEMTGLYIADLAAPTGSSPALSVSTIERRLSGLAWNYTQRGFALDRKNRHIATVLAGIKRKHARPPVQKEAILRDDILAMVATLPYDLRGLRDRAMVTASSNSKKSKSSMERIELLVRSSVGSADHLVNASWACRNTCSTLVEMSSLADKFSDSPS